MAGIQDAAQRLMKNSRPLGGGLGLLLGGAAVVYGIKESLYTVDGGHRSVIFSRIGGVQDKIYAEGLHFRIPWFQYPIIYNIRSRPTRIQSPTGSKDLQMVNIGLRVLTRPDAPKLPLITQTIGVDFDDKVLPSITNEVLKSVVAKFNASQLITQRAQVSLLIRRELTERARDFHLVLDDVAITDITFGREYAAAIEAKQVGYKSPFQFDEKSYNNKSIAQQEAQRAQFIVEKAKQERQHKVVQAEGEATIAKMVGEAISQNPAYLKLRRVKAAQNIAKTISQAQNKVYLDANSLLLNLSSRDYGSDDNMKLKAIKR